MCLFVCPFHPPVSTYPPIHYAISRWEDPPSTHPPIHPSTYLRPPTTIHLPQPTPPLAQADLGRRAIAELDAGTGVGLALTRPGPAHLPGGANYWVDVLAPGNSTAAAARIWSLDSGNRGCGRMASG